MAIYNTGRYLDNSICSLLNQTIGIKTIQIILINDGSSDNSEEICLRYQKLYLNNIIYLKTKNNGVSKARNIGMTFAKGEYINFLDPDDFWDSKAFENVLSFFRIHSEINFISGRLKFFEARNDYHPLDYKFYKTRVVNLIKEYNCIHSSSSTSFFKASFISGKKFEEKILSGEDTRFVNDILLMDPKMGLIREAVYFCRRRADLTSRTQTQKKDVTFYFSTIKNVSQYLINRSISLYNKIIPFIQFYVAYDLLFRIESLAYKYLNTFEYWNYINLIQDLLQNIEDKYIMEQNNVEKKFKILALSKKYNKDLRYNISFENGTFKYLNYNLINLKEARNTIIWKKISINDNILYLEGVDNLWIPREKYFYFCKFGDKIIFAKTESFSGYDFNSLFGVIEKGKVIIFEIPLDNIEMQILHIYISFMEFQYEILTTQGYYTHIPSVPDGYYVSGNFIIKMINNRIIIYNYNNYIESYFEKLYCEQLLRLGKSYFIKYRKEIKKYRRTSKNKNHKKEIWIINDRKNKAGDNGEYFFRYLRNKKPKELNVYFVIQKNCSDYHRLNNLGNILDLDSIEYLKMFLKADKLLSSIYNSWVDNPFGDDQNFMRDLFNFEFILIQSGIIKDDISKSLNRLNSNINLLVTSTIREYNYILESNYGFKKQNVILTGLPRFDNLEKYKKNAIKDNSKMILVLPTWRLYIKGSKDSLMFEKIHSDYFKYILMHIFLIIKIIIF